MSHSKKNLTSDTFELHIQQFFASHASSQNGVTRLGQMLGHVCIIHQQSHVLIIECHNQKKTLMSDTFAKHIWQFLQVMPAVKILGVLGISIRDSTLHFYTGKPSLLQFV